jgi:LPS-assembly lipoprotein
VKYQLKDTDTEATLFTGSARQFTGYSTTGTTAATISSERDARARLSVILADQIVAQLLLNTADLGL